MASVKQIELFRRLATDREFPQGSNLAQLQEQFGNLTDANASQWIERALELPKRDDSNDPKVPAPF